MFSIARILTPMLLVVLLVVGCSQIDNDNQILDPNQVSPTSNALVIPDGATVVSASLNVFVGLASAQQLNIHAITSDWDEATVTFNNFGAAYAAAVEGTFAADVVDWKSIDITTLALGWTDGSVANYGVLLDQFDMEYPRTFIGSRESVTYTPFLEVCYMYGGELVCVTTDAIADAYIFELLPDLNYGFWDWLVTGRYNEGDGEKQALIRFEIESEPPEFGCSLTIGFWKTHAGFGPQDDMVTALLPIWLGDPGGDKSLFVDNAGMAVDLLSQDVYGVPSNGITKLYAQFLGVKLNVANGASETDVASFITKADAFLADNDWTDWDDLKVNMINKVSTWHDKFDDYNNGLIGPGHCDDFVGDGFDDDPFH